MRIKAGTRRRARFTALLAVGAAAVGLSLPVPGATAKAVLACPDFTILHDDRINNVSLPHGRYEVKAKRVSCQRTTSLLQKWLQSGKTSGGWSAAPPGVFTKGGKLFRVDREGSGGGGSGGGGGGKPGRTVCPATFRVLHNDQIGDLRVPAGSYRITTRRMSCADATDQFRRFLNFPSGKLPDNWKLRPLKAKFRNPGTGASFRVKRVGS